MLVLLAALTTCDADAVAATLSQAQVVNEDVDAKIRRIDEVRAMLARDLAFIKQEQSNPGGVVSLRDLHETGIEVQSERAEIARLTAEARKEVQLASRVTAVAAQLMKPCPKDMVVTLARLKATE